MDDNFIRQNPTDRMLKELRIAHGHEVEKRKALSLAQQDFSLIISMRRNSIATGTGVLYHAHYRMRVGGSPASLAGCGSGNGIISVNHPGYYNHRDEVGTYYSINTPKPKPVFVDPDGGGKKA